MQPLLVTAAVIVQNGKILITRRPEGVRQAGFWEFPGGKVDPGESPEEALVREMREELAAAVVIEGIFEVVFHQYDWGPVLILAYRCRLTDATLHNIGVAEHRWVEPQALRDYSLLPADGPIVSHLERILWQELCSLAKEP